jgi:hypothetical protein
MPLRTQFGRPDIERVERRQLDVQDALGNLHLSRGYTPRVGPGIALRATGRFDRRFYTGMAAIAVLVGFAPTYYLRPRFVSTPLPFYLHAHGIVFSAWIAFFIAQAMLVAVRRTDVHRKLGWAGASLAALMVTSAQPRPSCPAGVMWPPEERTLRSRF